MPKTYDIEYLNRLIADQEEESLHLEYKAADALGKNNDKKKEISKDVSAMANANGGLIIYGIAEYRQQKHLPEKITPLNGKEFTREWLEQVINSNIQPKISNIVITPIRIDDDKVVFVVEVPPGETVHQAKDKIYYRRRNFMIDAMEDYQIREVMNRATKPTILINISISNNIQFSDRLESTDGQLTISFENTSTVIAKYVYVIIRVPTELLNNNFKFEYQQVLINKFQYTEIIISNRTRRGFEPGLDSIGMSPSSNFPILPGMKKYIPKVPLTNLETYKDKLIYWSIFVDNAKEETGEFLISDIIITNDQLEKI